MRCRTEISDRVAIETIVRSASYAPSLHNSQPWRFVAPAAPALGDVHIDIYAARERALWVVDPNERELHIACGAAIELGRVAGRSLGREVSIELLPSPQDPDLVGRLRLEGAYDPDEHDVRLAEAISLRYTDRGRFEPRQVSSADIDAIGSVVSVRGTWAKFLETPTAQLELYVLLDRADDLERQDPRYLDELAKWRRDDPQATDGIPVDALDPVPLSQRASSLRLRDFRAGSTDEPAPAAVPVSGGTVEVTDPGNPEPPPAEHPLVAIIGTVSDDPRAWLEGGRTLAAILLEAASRDISASPMSQVLEVTATRTMLAHALGLLGYPQMVLRMGYASGRPTSPRRPISEVLRFE